MELFFSKEIGKESLTLRGKEAEHCAKVLRHKVGETLFVIDGKGGMYRCLISDITLPKKGEPAVECSIEECSVGVGERNYSLIMAVCPTKNMERFEWFVEKATELGVDRIIPIVSEHSIRTTLKKERVEAVALSATKQSLKSYLPEIEECVSVKDFLHRDYEDTLKLIAHCEEGDKKSIRERLEGSSKGQSVVVMIGPEGDFSEKEIALALSKGYKPVTLGPSRLRVETAALAAVSEIYFASIS